VTENNPVDVLDAVRRRRGMSPIDSGRIAGAAPLREDGFFTDDYPDEEPRDYPEVPASPLVPPSVSQIGPNVEQVQVQGAPLLGQLSAAVPGVNLAVLETQAHFRGTDVALDSQDVNAIATIVLRAAARQVQARLSELATPVRRGGSPATRKDRPGHDRHAGPTPPPKRRIKQCSLCGQSGHNKATCKQSKAGNGTTEPNPVEA